MEYAFPYGPSPNYRMHTHTAPSMEEARKAARDKRNAGWSVGRIRRQIATGAMARSA